MCAISKFASRSTLSAQLLISSLSPKILSLYSPNGDTVAVSMQSLIPRQRIQSFAWFLKPPSEVSAERNGQVLQSFGKYGCDWLNTSEVVPGFDSSPGCGSVFTGEAEVGQPVGLLSVAWREHLQFHRSPGRC